MSAIKSTDKVLFEQREHVLLVTINRPEVRNAVDGEVHMTIGNAMPEIDADPNIWVVMITGAGDKAFSAGADLKATARGETVLPLGFEHWGYAGWVRQPISRPTIAVVNGAAMGGGAELVLSCDLVVAAEHAIFGFPEVKRGFIPADGGPFRSLQQLPYRVAMEMVLTGEPITAQQALEYHFVNRVVPYEQLLDAAFELAALITANSPIAVQSTKLIAAGISDGRRPEEDLRWKLTHEGGRRTSSSEDRLEGVKAFLEKRPPVWTGR